MSHASVHTLQEAQAASSNVTYQYTFEGSTDAERLEQSIPPGTPNLTTVTTGGFAITFETNPGNPGAGYYAFDNSSYAAFTKRGSSNQHGIALRADGTVTLTASGSIEYLIKANTINDNSAGLAGAAGTDSRWFFFRNGAEDSNTAGMIIGTLGQTTFIGGDTGVDYLADNWYYVAQTWSITDGVITLNAYVANLTAGDTVLTQTVDGVTREHGGGLEWEMRLGSGANSGANAGYFQGGFDAMAIYDSALEQADFQNHLNLVTVPESAGSAIQLGAVVCALVVIAGVCRRRRLRA